MTRWHRGWSRLQDLLGRSRVDRDIDDELRFHVEEELEAGIRRGLTPEQARQEAHASLGGTPLLVREQIHDAREVSLSDDFRRDVRQGARLLRRSPGVTTVVLCTLAVAIGAAVTAFSITDAWLFRPLRFPAADRLVVSFMATAARPTEPAVFMPYRAYLSWKDTAKSFSSISAAFFRGATWRTSSDAKPLLGMRVTPEFFSTLGVPALRGRHFAAADVDGPPALVISYGFWQRELGGAESVVGSTVTLSDVAYTVVGVMPAAFDVRLLDRPEGAAFWTLFRAGERGYEPGGMGAVAIVGRLADGVTIEAARAEVAAIMRQAESAYPLNFNAPDAAGNQFVVNLTSLQADNTRTVRATLLTVLAAALCLLLIASMNVGVLLLGRGLARRGEVAVRHALGAGRGRLVRQFLTESLVLSVGGGVLGIGLAIAGTRLFLAWNPLGTLPANGVQLDLRALAVATMAMAITTIVAGLVPAIRLSAAGPGAALRNSERGRATAPSQRAQRVMLVAQMAVSMVLLVCAALLARTFIELRAEPLGFLADGVAVAEVVLPTTPFDSSDARNAFYRQLEERLMALPGVRAVAAGTSPPLVGGAVIAVNLTAIDSMTAPRMSTQSVTTGFFNALDIPIIAGRAFDRRDAAQAAPVVVLNARAATALFGDARRAVGQRVRLDQEVWREVVGVAGNVRTTFFNTLEWRTDPMVYRPAAQGFARVGNPEATQFSLWVHIRADRPLTAGEVRDAALAAGPRAAVLSFQRVPDLVAVATKQPTVRMTLLLWFCGASLLLAAIGVYGLVTQAVTERLREIAIRIALGAHPRVVMAAFVRRALAAGLAGLAIGVVLAMALARTLESLLYGVRTGDVASLAVAAVLLLIVTGIAAWVPAKRATRVDAVHVLRG
jgi:predicted permease